jgi:hypothetical protein
MMFQRMTFDQLEVGKTYCTENKPEATRTVLWKGGMVLVYIQNGVEMTAGKDSVDKYSTKWCLETPDLFVNVYGPIQDTAGNYPGAIFHDLGACKKYADESKDYRGPAKVYRLIPVE